MEETNKTRTDIPALISAEALAERWGIKADTIRSWVRRKNLDGVRIGRKVLVRTDTLPGRD